LWLSLFLVMITGCSFDTGSEPLFTKLTSDQTSITFENTITENEGFTFSDFPFIFNGGGVAVGDINNDNLPDVYLTGNMVSSRLYLNKGKFRFEDITEAARVGTNRWVTGASFIDINSDGNLDLYLSVMGHEDSDESERANQLFINNGDQTFTEKAAEYGIDFSGFTTHAVFFDYNRDQHVDLFLLNNSPETFARSRDVLVRPEEQPKDPGGFDKLFRNNGDGSFTDVSDDAGIEEITGYGLGVVTADFNRDGWPDLYVSNDISSNDVLYINNGDGTFSNRRADYLMQTSYAGMGMDAADFNNDGWIDIMQTDMMPEQMSERKQLSGAFSYQRFQKLRQLGYHYYYSKNSLQLNRGVDPAGNLQFSEIARMAGVAYTDWSWTALFGDFDNSGFKDILITNGYPKAVNNFDYLLSLSREGLFGTEETVRARRKELYENLHGISIPNYLFRNTEGLQFEDVSEEWGFKDSGFSYGAATADLDNNGSLDIIINNINEPASIYQNNSSILKENHHFLQLKLEGKSPNRQGLGSEITVYAGGEKQYFYHTIYRGYQSTVDERIHIGLGSHSQVDSLSILWPDSSRQVLRNVEANQQITLRQENAIKGDYNKNSETPTLFKEVDIQQVLDYSATEDNASDFLLQTMLPYMLSRTGPPIAVGDFTGNGLDDIFIGGKSGEPGSLFIQNEDGTFTKHNDDQFLQNDQDYHDTAASFFDANGDGLPDLYVASGGYRVSAASNLLQDRLYINRGDGEFIRDQSALPRMLSNTSTVQPGDFTGDGQIDIYIGGGTMPGNYPSPSKSYLLVNDNGHFSDHIDQLVSGLSEPGIVKDAAWVDYNNDNHSDLITAGEWQPIRVYKNDRGQLREVTDELGLSDTKGWWFSIAADDFNKDGRMDIVAGNIGLNHTFSVLHERKPVELYAGDFNRDQHTELIFTYEDDGADYPIFGLAKLGSQIRDFTDRYPNFRSFADVPVQNLFREDLLQNAMHISPDIFESAVFFQKENGSYSKTRLPDIAQISSIHAILSEDFDGDNHTDLLLTGNMFHTEPNIPRLDAGKGLFLKGDGKGQFYPKPISESGFITPKDSKQMVSVNTPGGEAVLVVNSDGTLQFFRSPEND
ncbi:MAG: VCBS repeat-containing protein, partial [Balneolaceae bacterium]|nr:VCBS repeat-containing protein [Balneolaceae bacterium]